MDGDTKEDDPRTVRPINSAIPYVISKRIAPERFIRKFGQRTPADVAASMLSEGGGQVILNVWLHWEVPAMLCWMGVPITGWNSVSLDEETQATYKVREERERVGRRNEKMREAGLSPPGCGMLLMLEAAAELLVGGEEEGRRERGKEGEKERSGEREREEVFSFFSFSFLSFLFPFSFPLSLPLLLSLSLSPPSSTLCNKKFRFSHQQRRFTLSSSTARHRDHPGSERGSREALQRSANRSGHLPARLRAAVDQQGLLGIAY